MESPAAKKFPKAVVYVLQCVDNYYYIGSTINDPRYRLNNHKMDSVKYPNRSVYEHINQIGWDNVNLDIVEQCPCDDRKELYAKEDEYIKDSLSDPYCLNHQRACISKEDIIENRANYYLANRDQIREKTKAYVEANKDKVDEYQAEYRIKNAEARREYTAQYVIDHPEEVAASRKNYYETNKAEILEKKKKYVEANKDEISRKKKEWGEKNKEHCVAVAKAWAEKNKGKIQERGKKYYEENKAIIREKNKAYVEANKAKLLEQQKEYRAANKAKLSESHTCDCGGKYTMNHEKIHRDSKRHKKFFEGAGGTCVVTGDLS
jgi:hypothetical protein